MSLRSSAYFIVTVYFQFWARIVLHRWKPIIIAVVGSAGKTTTMSIIEQVLKETIPIKISYKTNAASAIPLNILGLSQHSYSISEWIKLLILAPVKSVIKPTERVYLCELDTDRTGEMTLHTRLIQPDICCWVSATPAHTANFSGKTRDEIFQNMLYDQKQAVLKTKSLILYNGDDNSITSIKHEFTTKNIALGINGQSDVGSVVSLIEHTLSFNGTQVRFKLDKVALFQLTGKNITEGEIDIQIPFSLVSKINVYGMAMAVLLGLSFGMDTKQIARALRSFRLPPGRMSLFAGKHATSVIDSSYNASKVATIDALEVLKEIGTQGTVAVLGDLRELGAFAESEHIDLAKNISKLKIDRVVLVGPQMQEYVLPRLLQAGYIEGTNVFSLNPNKAKQILLEPEFIKSGSTILVKGSQNTLFLEEIVESLLASKKDIQYLCRREPIWDKARSLVYES